MKLLAKAFLYGAGTLMIGACLVAPMVASALATPEAVARVVGVSTDTLNDAAGRVMLVLAILALPVGGWMLSGMLRDQVRYSPQSVGGRVLMARAQQGVVVVDTDLPRGYELAQIIGSGAKRVGTTPDGLAEYVVRPQRMSAETAARYITERADMLTSPRRVGARWSVMPAHDGRPARAEMRVHVNRDEGRWPTIRDTDGGLGDHDL